MYSLLFSMALLLAPQINPRQPPAAVGPEQKCAISGTVLSASTGQPLRDAAVTLRQVGVQGSGPVSVVSDAGGRFEIKNLDPGRYFVNASHAGYVSMQYGQKGPNGLGRTLTLRPGQSAHNISFELLSEAVITGHVYDEAGEPVEHVQVRAERFRYMQGKRRLLPADMAMTDDRGKYRLFDLPPGKYYISASGGPGRYGSSFSYQPTYYPGVTDASQASPITLQAGNEFPDVDLTLQRVGTFHVRGRVINNLDTASGRTDVMLVTRREPFESFSFGNSVKDRQGDFDIPGVLPGLYYAVARFFANGKMFASRQPVTITDSDVNGIQLVLTPGATLGGVVTTEGSVDLSKARIFLRPRETGISFVTNTSTTIKPDGTFEIDSLPDGGYSVRFFGVPANAYVKSAKLGGEDVLDSGFAITNGEAPGSTLRIVVSANGGTIGGTVMLDGKPFNSALVTLLPEDSAKLSDDWWFKTTTTDQYGNFTLAGIRPGDYRLFAWEKIEQGEERDPDFYNQLKDQGQEVHVGPGAALNFQLTAIPAKQTQAVEAQ
jgi:Carboxypeptidase regulatory-like domain